MAVLDVRGLFKHFGGLTAVNDLSFSVEEGQVLGIVGPNGSGKTTAFNLITGFIKPEAGQVFLDGENITLWKPYRIVRKGMARTFQVVKVFRQLSVHENIKVAKMLTIKTIKDLNERVEEIVSLVGLKGKGKEYAINLPIGDLKRLEIARALATDPRVLLLDEPFSGLSHHEVEEISYFLQDLVKHGTTIVIVEHVLRELRKIAENIIVLDFGAKIAEGKFGDVINQQVVREAYLGGAASAYNR
ncbi:MAG: ABC transporter ATP-binding protein [Thermodesulfobacteriota bacterium]